MRWFAAICAMALALLAVIGVFAFGDWFAAPAPGTEPVVSSDAAERISDPDLAGDRTAAADAADAAVAAATRADALRGSDSGGAVRTDAQGRPLPDRELRRLFDSFLARADKPTPETTRSALLTHLQPRLTTTGLVTVLAWFDAYLALEHDSAAIAQADNDSGRAFARLRSLRRERLGDDLAEAWYGEEEHAYELAGAQSQRVFADASINDLRRRPRLPGAVPGFDPNERRREDALGRGGKLPGR